jgi:hypothetical protein
MITGHTERPNVTCSKIMIVNAGGKGRGVISINTAPKKTNTYCHHIVFICVVISAKKMSVKHDAD